MSFRIRKLTPADPPDSFPDPRHACQVLGYPDGLIAIGGDLSPPRLIEAYRQGIFPWFNDDQPILWWSPDPRAVIPVADFHMSRSTARELKCGDWSWSVNAVFGQVINRCASERGDYGTWITADMQTAYEELHRLGYAHSVEAWKDGELAGGIYGIRLGNMFFGESMFSTQTNGSKVAISALVRLCREDEIDLIDCQVSSPHLTTLGMTEISRASFLAKLRKNPFVSTDFKAPAGRQRPAQGLAALRGQN